MSHPTGDYHRPNQLWRCAAECESKLGPTPWGTCRGKPRCTPRLSVRGRRDVFVASCVFATLGLTLLALAGPWRNTVLQPGPLSSAHAQALESVTDADRCATCHEAAAKDPLAWIKIASGNISSLSEDQATRCLNCHEQSLDSQFARHPHNVSPDALARTTQRIAGAAGLDDLVRVKLAGEKACATCHKEHHGVHANLAELTDQQCQACHVRAFESFAEGHPEFRHILPSPRSTIPFDHVSHVNKHFPEKQQAFACNQCHVDDAGKNVKQLAGFEQSCARCHSRPLEATTQEGLIAFSFPVLDAEKLKAAGQDIGAWPSAATGDFDGPFPPLVRTLLMADDEAAAALEALDPAFDFAQVQVDKDLKAVAALAWSHKRLLNDLANDSAAAIRSRLEKVAGRKLADHQLEGVLRQLQPALFREARRRWLPGLHDELAKSGRAQPQRLTAVTTIAPQVRSELLVENPLAKGNQAPTIAPQTPQVVKPIEVPAPVVPPGETASEPQHKPAKAAASDPGELASSGTWYLDDATLSVRYRPRGHADELMRLLIDVGAAASSRHVPQQGLLATTLQEASFNTCAGCHSIDTAAEHYAVNWHVQYRDASRRQFVEFSHRPHLLQSRLADCTHCHQLDLSRASADPMAHAHDFQPITKSSCAACHTKTESGGRCTLCHSYHVGAVRGH